jgi:tetratricopeptide (TPR) repeat protein
VPRQTVAETALDPQRTEAFAPPAAAQAGGLPAVPGYEIMSELGRGGMGVVYKAVHRILKRPVALKMLLSRAHAGPHERTRFRTEAEAVARLQHPNIVQIHEVGEHEGLEYFSLEFVDGGSLAQRLAAGPLPFDQAAALAATLARAMHHAHQRGVIHRDLKPANVLLTAEGTPKVTDFGLAKHLETDSGQTRSGAVMGTPSYMAPEQAAGDVRAIGPLTDVYALGAVLYELLIGQPPFRGANIRETLDKVCTRDPVPPSRVRPRLPRDLETVCLKALTKEPGRRYPSALALAEDLDRYRAGEAVLGRREGPLGRLLRRARRRPRTTAGVVAAVAVVTVSILLALQSSLTSRSDRLQREIATALGVLDPCSDEQLARIEGWLAELSQWDAPAAAALREQLLAGQCRALGQQIHQAALPPEAVERIRHGIALTGRLDPGRAAELTAALQQRLGGWQPAVELNAPFDSLAAVFGPGPVHRDGDGLAAGPGGRVLTVVPCGSGGEIWGTFRIAPGDPLPVGVMLNATTAGGYAFVATPEKEEKDRRGARIRVRIQRNNAVLREDVLPVDEVPAALELRASRTGNLLTVRINDGMRMESRDPFPLVGDPGVFGPVWPRGAALTALTASRQTLPADPSALEQGDVLYDRGRYREALELYRREAATAAGAVREEAQYKQALCLLATGREAEALVPLQELGGAAKGDWRNRADCQAWLVLAGRRDAQDLEHADALLDRLSARGLAPGQLASLVPQQLRDRVLGAHNRGDAFSDFLLEAPDKHIMRHRRDVEIQRLFGTDRDALTNCREALLRAYHYAGEVEAALAVGQEILAQYKSLAEGNDFPRRALVQMTWAQRSQGRATEALTLLDHWLQSPDAEALCPNVRQLHLERARLLATLGRWTEVEPEVESVLKAGKVGQAHQAEACLLQGFLCERRGDHSGAAAAWRRGFALAESGADTVSLSTQVYRLMMGSLTDSLSDEDARRFRSRMIRIPGGAGLTFVTDMAAAILGPDVFRGMWKTPRGREAARRIAWREATLAETYRLPFFLLVAEAVRRGAFAGPLTAEQDELVWGLVLDLHAGYVAGSIPPEQVSGLVLAWKGSTLLWGGTAARLDPKVRGPLAYVLGQRMRLRKQPGDAEAFFKAARDAAQPGSALSRLAAAELKP